MVTIKSPKAVEELKSNCVPPISMAAPDAARKTPLPRVSVILSLSSQAANTTTKMGVQVMSTAPLMGVVNLSPLKNNSILKPTPNTLHSASLYKSFLSCTFSLMNRE